jgi:hypothetical protein
VCTWSNYETTEILNVQILFRTLSVRTLALMTWFSMQVDVRLALGCVKSALDLDDDDIHGSVTATSGQRQQGKVPSPSGSQSSSLAGAFRSHLRTFPDPPQVSAQPVAAQGIRCPSDYWLLRTLHHADPVHLRARHENPSLVIFWITATFRRAASRLLIAGPLAYEVLAPGLYLRLCS